MATPSTYDAVIVGSGPNGLSAGIRLAREGLQVLILEAGEDIGGGTRTRELTDPGFLHDVCSAVHPTAAGSPFFNKLPLQQHGLTFIHPEIPYAHPLEDGEAAISYRSLDQTAQQLGVDDKNYRLLFDKFVSEWERLSEDIFGDFRIPTNPFLMARFGWYGMFSAKMISNSLFKTDKSKALFAGAAGHSMLPLNKAFTSAFGLILAGTAHAVGWPVAKGGSASISRALGSYFKSLGGEIKCNHHVYGLKDIPPAKAILFDLTPHQIADIAAGQLPGRYLKKLRNYQYGPGVFKVDWALSEPVPWINQDCRKAGTLHLGGSLDEIAAAEQAVWQGEHPPKPYVLLSQPSLFDDSRAPSGKHTLWAYCHVPNGSQEDMTDAIENQVERFAPGFKEIILSKNTMHARQIHQYNSNYVGGDINGGAQFFKQLFGRPVLKWDPYKIPDANMYICSASTPPGGGVHGMCGYHAAQSVLKNEFGIG